MRHYKDCYKIIDWIKVKVYEDYLEKWFPWIQSAYFERSLIEIKGKELIWHDRPSYEGRWKGGNR